MVDIGRPAKYTDNEVLKTKIEEYMNFAYSKKKPLTVSGLCIYLGISKDTFSRYAKQSNFSETIKMARLMIENWTEEAALTGDIDRTVAIFSLKANYKWKDKQDIDVKADMKINVGWGNDD